MKTIAFVSTKGGVGKSSCTILMANYLGALGKSVLVIDTDYSNSTTLYYLETKAGLNGKGFSAAIRSGSLVDNIVPTRNEQIDIIPSNTDIEKLVLKEETQLSTLINNEANALNQYDYIIIDTSQGYNSIVANAIRCADLILTPVMLCQFDMISCLTLQTKIIDADKLSSWGLFFNGVSPQAQTKNSSHNQYISLYKKTFTQCLNVFIPKTSAVTNAIDRDMKIVQKKNEKLFHGITELVSIVVGSDVSGLDSF
jgi:chromosome partitioning protein